MVLAALGSIGQYQKPSGETLLSEHLGKVGCKAICETIGNTLERLTCWKQETDHSGLTCTTSSQHIPNNVPKVAVTRNSRSHKQCSHQNLQAEGHK